jgi:hypothetical protein
VEYVPSLHWAVALAGFVCALTNTGIENASAAATHDAESH